MIKRLLLCLWIWCAVASYTSADIMKVPGRQVSLATNSFTVLPISTTNVQILADWINTNVWTASMITNWVTNYYATLWATEQIWITNYVAGRETAITNWSTNYVLTLLADYATIAYTTNLASNVVDDVVGRVASATNTVSTNLLEHMKYWPERYAPFCLSIVTDSVTVAAGGSAYEYIFTNGPLSKINYTNNATVYGMTSNATLTSEGYYFPPISGMYAVFMSASGQFDADTPTTYSGNSFYGIIKIKRGGTAATASDDVIWANSLGATNHNRWQPFEGGGVVYLAVTDCVYAAVGMPAASTNIVSSTRFGVYYIGGDGP